MFVAIAASTCEAEVFHDGRSSFNLWNDMLYSKWAG